MCWRFGKHLRYNNYLSILTIEKYAGVDVFEGGSSDTMYICSSPLKFFAISHVFRLIFILPAVIMSAAFTITFTLAIVSPLRSGVNWPPTHIPTFKLSFRSLPI
jgi:hypothetical protein